MLSSHEDMPPGHSTNGELVTHVSLYEYDREKLTRIMPDNLILSVPYTLRLKALTGENCGDIPVLIAENEKEGRIYKICFFRLDEPVDEAKRDDPDVLSWYMGENGLVYDNLNSSQDTGDLPPEEVGYIVGSTHPWDIELANMNGQPPRI